MSQKVEKVQKGGEGSAPEIKKSTIQNVDFLIRGGGVNIMGHPVNLMKPDCSRSFPLKFFIILSYCVIISNGNISPQI